MAKRSPNAGLPDIVGFFREETAMVVGLAAVAIVLPAGALLDPSGLPTALTGLIFAGVFTIMLWCSFGVVRHADLLAELLGEPYGTLLLTLSVISIEVILIATVMLTGENNVTLARDTMFAVLMIAMNGLVGLSLLVGGLGWHTQQYNLEGANAFLAVIIPLAVLGLIVPNFTVSAPGGQVSPVQEALLVALSVGLYGIFLALQTTRHNAFFRQPDSPAPRIEDNWEDDQALYGDHGPLLRPAFWHALMLLGAMVPIALLAKTMAILVDYGIFVIGAPPALGGLVVALLVLTPEGLSAIQAAQANRLQRAVNIGLGSALATIGLTIPAVLTIALLTDKTVVLGLEASHAILLALTLLLSSVTLASSRTNMLQGLVHITLFMAYLALLFDH